MNIKRWGGWFILLVSLSNSCVGLFFPMACCQTEDLSDVNVFHAHLYSFLMCINIGFMVILYWRWRIPVVSYWSTMIIDMHASTYIWRPFCLIWWWLRPPFWGLSCLGNYFSALTLKMHFSCIHEVPVPGMRAVPVSLTYPTVPIFTWLICGS